jgi:RNA 3'-terminal phosphate cyclase (ATP)
MSELITLDGSQGEGGGQILRSALALSVITGRPFRISRIRARRPKPGLMRQHLACAEAAARIGSAAVEGAALGSTEITFRPGAVAADHYEFKIASAGSTMLLLQTILPPLLLAHGPSEVVLEGGTHNPFAPPFPFIERAFLPLLRRIGFDVEAGLERAGFYPNGGGRCRVAIRPAKELKALRLNAHGLPVAQVGNLPFRRLAVGNASEEATPADCQSATQQTASLRYTDGAGGVGGERQLSANVCLAGLPRQIGERELAAVRQRLAFPPERCTIKEHTEAFGPGNSLHVFADGDGFANVFTGFGAPRVRSEQVADEAVGAAEAFLASGAAVDEHLADQLLLPLALARGGSFITTEPSGHTRTNLEVIREFLPNRIALEPVALGQWRITVEPTDFP